MCEYIFGRPFQMWNKICSTRKNDFYKYQYCDDVAGPTHFQIRAEDSNTSSKPIQLFLKILKATDRAEFRDLTNLDRRPAHLKLVSSDSIFSVGIAL